MKRVVIFVDGQNLFYTLKGMELQERMIHWGRFLRSLIEPECEILRTYWFRPQKLHDRYYTSTNIAKMIISNELPELRGYLRDPTKVPVGPQRDQLKYRIHEVENWLKEERTRFSSIEHNYDVLSSEFGDIEIVKAGVVKINPVRQEYIGEKGVDIALAVKMVAFSYEKKCDVAVLVSGDFDYAEAIKQVKNQLVKVAIVKFFKGEPPQSKNMSSDLSFLADRIIPIYESELKRDFLK